MSDNIFHKLRTRMTYTYAAIFGLIISVIILCSCALIGWSILEIEKHTLYEKVIHEGEEWISSKEAPVSEKELTSGTMLAYFEAPDGKSPILNQLGNSAAGKALYSNRNSWPSLERKTRLIRIKDKAGNSYRYLASVAVIKDGNHTIGVLYIFKNFQEYYNVAITTLKKLFLLFIILFTIGIGGSYYLSGKNIRPISDMYEKQKQFTADASHEMRTPLAVLKLSCEGIATDEESRLSQFSCETIEMMATEVNRLTKLTENLMTLARSDNGHLHINFSEFDLSQIAAKIVLQMQLLAEKQNITILSQIQPYLKIYGDPNGLNRLLIILLDNAIKYSNAFTDITIIIEKQGRNVLIKVIDYGQGISDEDKVKVFDRFYRVDKARSRAMGGLGLGLSLAQAIVTEHNGKIWITDNSQGKGTCFNVSLPIKSSK